MASHSKNDPKEKSAEKTAAPTGRISGKEGMPAGIRKPKQRLRRLKLAAKNAAAAVAIAAGLAATAAPAPASAKNMSSLTGLTDIRSSRSSMSVEEAPAYGINLPDEFAPFSKGQSTRERIVTLSKKSSLAQSFEQFSDGQYALAASGGEIHFMFRNPEVLVFGADRELAFILNISEYGMLDPVPRLEETKDMKAILHIIDVQTGTDLTLTFPLFSPPEMRRVKAKAFQDPGAAEKSRIARQIEGIVGAAEKMLESQNPKTIDESHDLYSEIGAEMVNQLREKCAEAPPEQATELAKRGQAVITAVLLRLYLSDDEDALTELDRLRTDPNLDKKILESFAWKNGILDEFQKIWPQCSASLEE